jgi:Fe-Mn family superoxide dismutase
MEHSLSPLPYQKSALSPHLSEMTLNLHHGKHHMTYVENLNKLIKGTEFESYELTELVRKSSGAIFNNAAQIWNHSFFWRCMKPGGGGKPKGELAEAIIKKWGSYDEFKKEFLTSAVDNFGSGWTWLVKKENKSLCIVNTSNAGTPLTTTDTPIITLDVWEHSYYVDYYNRRLEYAEAFIDSLVNWDFAEINYILSEFHTRVST